KSQREHIPIFIASVGRKNVELTGELADGWAPIYLSAKHMDKFRAWLDEGASRSKRNSNVIEVRPYTIVCVSDDIRIAKTLAKGHLAFYIGGMGRYYHDLVARYGYVEETAAIKDFFAKHERGKAADAVTDAMLSELAVVGTAEQCRQQIVDLQGAGMGSPVLYIPNGSPQEVWSDTIEGLSPRSFR
ncbi:LLM class flavin-dependent oxidoreductase, partial [Dehalococcoidia bacterium]|nr:LLM class flavin-dependent oxidoreductase [Dehalococcoidia bacterium]